MTINSFTDWSTTAASNTDIAGIGITGSNKPSNFDNALRALMAQLKSGVPAKVATTTDNALARFDGTTGQMQGCVVIVTDAGAVSGVSSLSASGAIDAGSFIAGGGAGFASSIIEAGATAGIVSAYEYNGADGLGSCSASNRSASNGAVDLFYRGGNQVGSISVTASATAFNTSSDYRVKDEVVPYAGGLAAIQSLKPCTFVMKADPDRIRQIGFIAHEVQAVLPQAVTGEKDAVDESGDIITQQLDLSKIVPALVSSVQELAAEVAELRNQISSL